VVSGIAPFITEYNSGSRYFGTSSATKAEKAGVSSEGLSTQALPAAMAPACSEVCQMSDRLLHDNFAPEDQVTITRDS